MKYTTRTDKSCYCHTRDKDFHCLGINRHVARSGLTVLLGLVIFSLLIGLSMSISSSELNSQTELSARCRSLGGEMGNGKCFKNGKEI